MKLLILAFLQVIIGCSTVSQVEQLRSPSGNVIGKHAYLWPDGIVYYQISNEVPLITAEVFREAARIWQKKTPVRFIEGKSSRGYILVCLGSTLGSGSSAIGFQGGIQRLSLNLDRGGSLLSVHLHEIGHALGLYHEQVRYDRENYIEVFFDNIEPQALHNFFKNGYPVGPYDFKSIMHYSKHAFSKNGSEVMRRRNGHDDRFGMGSSLSDGDVLAIYRIYGTRKDFLEAERKIKLNARKKLGLILLL
jgi:hypothetical protein